jgi:hypothetical protein
MVKAQGYRLKAAESAAKARHSKNPAQQVEYAKIAAAYLRLAEHADRNAANDVIYDPPRQTGGAKA